MEKDNLVNLSAEIRNLINNGVYSMYSIGAVTPDDARYILFTLRHSFLLNGTGKLLSLCYNFQLPVEQTIIFIDIDGTPHSDLKKFA